MKMSLVFYTAVLACLTTVVVFFMVVKTSLGVTGALFTVVIAWLVLGMANRLQFASVPTPHDINLLQTGASAGGALASSAIYLLALQFTGNKMDPALLFCYLLATGGLGLMLAIPLRYQFIVRERLPFPSGIACYELIETLFTQGGQTRLLRNLGGGFLGGVVWKVVLAMGWLKDKIVPADGIIPYSKLLFGVALEPILFGAGMMIGPRVSLTLGIGAALVWLWLVPAMVEAAVISDLAFGPARAFLVYPAIAWLLAAGLAQLVKTLATVTWTVGDPGNPAEKLWPIPFRWWLLTVIVLLVLTLFLLHALGVSFSLALLAIGGSLVFAFIAIKCIGATDVGPLSTLSNLMLLFQAKAGSPAPLYPSSATMLVASLGSDTLYDFKTGYLLQADPKPQIWMQMVGLIAGAATLTALFAYLVFGEGLALGSPEYPAATSQAVADLAKSLVHGADIPSQALGYAAVAALLGLVAGYLETTRFARWTPSSVALGIAMILPPQYSFALAAGGAISVLFGKAGMSDTSRFALGTGLIVADSLSTLALFWR